LCSQFTEKIKRIDPTRSFEAFCGTSSEQKSNLAGSLSHTFFDSS
jgi:hypothetical protein